MAKSVEATLKGKLDDMDLTVTKLEAELKQYVPFYCFMSHPDLFYRQVNTLHFTVIFFLNLGAHSIPFIPKKYKNANLSAQRLVVWRLNPPPVLFRRLAPRLPPLVWPVRVVITLCLRLVPPYIVSHLLCLPCLHLLLRQRPALLLNTCAAPLFLLAPDLSHLHARRHPLSVTRHPSAPPTSALPRLCHLPSIGQCPSRLPLPKKLTVLIPMNRIEK